MHLFTVTLLLCSTAFAKLAPLIFPDNTKHVIPGRFIVVLKDGAEMGSDAGINMQQHESWLVNMLSSEADSESAVEHQFSFDGITGYTGKFSDKMIESIRGRKEVSFIEPDQIMYALDSDVETASSFRRRKYVNSAGKKKKAGKLSAKNLLDMIFEEGNALFDSIMDDLEGDNGDDAEEKPEGEGKLLEVQDDAPWGLSRVSHSKMPSGLSKYTYPKSAGKDVNVYIVDTGINIAHEDFEGRAKWGATIPMFDEDIDGNGHGTHCAGTIGSKTYGIAKKATLYAVKVLRTNGFGTNSDVIKGIEWVIKAHKKTADKQSVANMSLGGGRSLTLEKAVNKAVESGVHFAVAAGNDNEDACNYSPAAAEGPVTVGASTNKDTMAFFSNHGSCVDIFAPGLDIKSTWIGGKDAVNTISGTSMASPHVAGVIALHLSQKSYKPEELKKLLKKQATKDALTGLPGTTENLLLSIEPLLKDL